MNKIKTIASIIIIMSSATGSTINGMYRTRLFVRTPNSSYRRLSTTITTQKTFSWWDPRSWKIFNTAKLPISSFNNPFKFWKTQKNSWFSAPEVVVIFNPENQEQANLLLDDIVTNTKKIELLNETITNTPNKQFFIEWAKINNNLLLLCQNSTPAVGAEILNNLMSLEKNNDLIKAFIDQANTLYNTNTGKWFIDNLLQKRAIIQHPITGNRVRTLVGPLHALANQLIFQYKNPTIIGVYPKIN